MHANDLNLHLHDQCRAGFATEDLYGYKKKVYEIPVEKAPMQILGPHEFPFDQGIEVVMRKFLYNRLLQMVSHQLSSSIKFRTSC